jgi:hypothetical protein
MSDVSQHSDPAHNCAALAVQPTSRDRTRRYRARQKRGQHRVTMTVPHAWIEKLIERGYLNNQTGNYPAAFEGILFDVFQ